MTTKKRFAKVKVSERDIRAMRFDTDRHPLLHKVWSALEKKYSTNNRQWILDNCHGKNIPKKSTFGGTLKRNMPRSGNMPVEFKMNERNDREETELKKFLDDVYRIEEINAEHIELQNATDAVTRLKVIPEARGIAAKLSEDIEYLQKNYDKIGLFAIIPNRDKPYKQMRFMTFEAFSDEFIKRAKSAFRHGKIPNFEFCHTSYIRLISEIVRITPWIINSCNEQRDRLMLLKQSSKKPQGGGRAGTKPKFACPPAVGNAFMAVYDYAQHFERSHHELSYDDVGRGEQTLSGAEAAWKKTHATPKFDYDKLRLKVINYVNKNKKNPCRSIDLAAKELAGYKDFPCSKKIKEKFKEELEPMRTPKKIKI